MDLTKAQKSRIARHVKEIGFIAIIIIVVWALTAIAKAQGW